MFPTTPSRRQFIQSASTAIAAPVILPSSILGQSRTSPGNRITLGAVGMGSKGIANLRNFLYESDVQVVAVCDVHDSHHRDAKKGEGTPLGRKPAKQIVEKHYAETTRLGTFAGCDAYADYRELCARDDIDAIMVATPDHWHALCALEALRNGKDVYGEKPITHLFAEGQALCREVANRGTIYQVGSQQRSQTRFRIGAEIVMNGLLGKIKNIEVGLPTGHSHPVNEPSVATKTPKGLDYDFWCGPSEKLPYIFARHHRYWRFHDAYGGGQIMDWIGHHNDVAHWGIGMDYGGPVEVEAIGWTFPQTDVYNTAVNYDIRCRYKNGIKSSISDKHAIGVKWVGENGWVHISRKSMQASNPEFLRESFNRGKIKADVSNNHTRNFIECVRSRKSCIAPAEVGHRSITPGHLGIVSQAVGRPLKWDPKTETIIGDEEADRLLKAVPYRKPWKLG
ncbi:MAG: Gfo/Idh/MocA family oxidoreductase [Verrucomicrobiota bacterium]|nr:Gfo/Idh/MocA family oxidoreductase [Verrucomicrobiota bacterium]